MNWRDFNFLRFTKMCINCSEIQNTTHWTFALVLTKSVVVFWVNCWQNVLIWQGTTCAIRTNGKNFNPLGCRNIRIGCFKGLGQSNNPIFCWYVSKHIWRCKIMRWKSRYRCCVDNSSSSASLDSKKWKNAIFAQKRVVKKKGTLKMSSTYLPIMAIRVVEFSNGGYKIRKIFAWEATYSKDFIEFWELG